ncbi:MAG: flagellar filament capping protein FliD [Alphaproteobacteria bacterium]|nr:flagellar filament capping protein FliD [Alphaproteobacteria bacterium]
MVNIIGTLGAGSGIDTARLADDLAAAARTPRASALAARRAGVTAELGALAQSRSAVAGLAAAVGELATGARLRDATAAGDRDALAAIVADLAASLDAVRGSLAQRSLPAASRSVGAALAALTTRQVDGVSLSALGVATERSGALRIDRARLTSALAADTGAVQRLVAGPNGLAAALEGLNRSFSAAGGPVAAAEGRLRRAQSDIDRATAALDARTAANRESLLRQFAAMERAVGAYRAQQTSVQQQVDAWTAGLRSR